MSSISTVGARSTFLQNHAPKRAKHLKGVASHLEAVSATLAARGNTNAAANVANAAAAVATRANIISTAVENHQPNVTPPAGTGGDGGFAGSSLTGKGTVLDVTA